MRPKAIHPARHLSPAAILAAALVFMLLPAAFALAGGPRTEQASDAATARHRAKFGREAEAHRCVASQARCDQNPPAAASGGVQ